MSPDTPRPLRADAERNRRLIMSTAARMFARRGSAVTLNEIAREAGLGVATVYRRFPDLQTLFDALFVERFTVFLGLATAAAERPDAGQALRHYLLEAARWRAEDQALEVILAHADLEAGPVGRLRDELGEQVAGLAGRAVAAGAVREDFAGADVYAFVYMVGAIADRTEEAAPGTWRRYAEALLIGFGLEHAPPTHTSALSDGQLRETWPKPTPANGN
ncbi:TetR/AcrR family transcriptional regulator [Streptomyces sp. NPDC091279]|uniref:TetR/AcrR family transcriptional regulator n=1 Tax=unclassified Streptomyces TaxID=2593676 RepID=UPI00380913A5